jgi:uncharacterized protein YndB with AHSA1/START domain
VTTLPPVHRSVIVPLDQRAAFDLFVRRLGEWWPLATRSVALADAESCEIEPRVGGRIFERTRAGMESDWGVLLAFEEPSRLVFSWHPGMPPATATEVEVTFVPTGDQTRVDVEHRHFERLGDRAAFVRALYEGGWPGVLARFETLARGDHELPAVDGPGCIPREEHARARQAIEAVALEQAVGVKDERPSSGSDPA